MELLIGFLLGVITVLIVLAALATTRRLTRKPAAPPRPTGRGRPSGDREPRRPLVPAGSAAAAAEPEKEQELDLAAAIRDAIRERRRGERSVPRKSERVRGLTEKQERIAGQFQQGTR